MDAPVEIVSGSRKKCRLRRSSWAVFVVVLVSLLLANIPGERQWLGLSARHGWPATWLYRSGLTYPVGHDISLWPWIAPEAKAPEVLRAIFAERSEFRIAPSSVAINSLVVLGIATGCAAAFEVWRRQRSRLVQFGLAESLAVVTLCGCLFGGWRLAAQRHAEELSTIAALKGLEATVGVQFSGPDWLQDVWNGQFLAVFDRPVYVGLGPGDRFCGVWASYVAERNSKIDDAKLSPLAGLTTLTEVDLDYVQITDDGLRLLEPSRGLRKLSLAGTKVTDAGINRLIHFRSLDELNIQDTQVSAAARKRLHQALPSCKIEF